MTGKNAQNARKGCTFAAKMQLITKYFVFFDNL